MTISFDTLRRRWMKDPKFRAEYKRIGPDMEFALHIEPTDPAVADPDPQVAATALNAGIERIARRDPTQYQWTYKRYTLRPPGSGEEDPYATEEHPH